MNGMTPWPFVLALAPFGFGVGVVCNNPVGVDDRVVAKNFTGMLSLFATNSNLADMLKVSGVKGSGPQGWE
jgi:hypothetical protein